MSLAKKGIVICPTGGGKTLTFITNCRSHLKGTNVIVVVSPTLDLLQQIKGEFDYHLSDVKYHLREISSKQRKQSELNRHHGIPVRGLKAQNSTTFVDDIRLTYEASSKKNVPLILFTTYASMNRITLSEIPVTVTYYDEAHNSATAESDSEVFLATKKMVGISEYNYFFTATPKNSRSDVTSGVGMNNKEVYGEILYTVRYDYLLTNGHVVPPCIDEMQTTVEAKKVPTWKANVEVIREVIDYYENNKGSCSGGDISESIPNNKILICAQGSKVIHDMVKKGGFVSFAKERGYHTFITTAKYGKYIDGVRVKSDVFFKTLNKYGEDADKKFLVVHYAQIAEGIDIKSMTGIVFLRSTANDTYITQAVGRASRPFPGKKWSYVIIPSYADIQPEVKEDTRRVVESLICNGIPPEIFISDTLGKGEEETELDIPKKPTDPKNYAEQAAFDWIHKNALETLIQQLSKTETFSLCDS